MGAWYRNRSRLLVRLICITLLFFLSTVEAYARFGPPERVPATLEGDIFADFARCSRCHDGLYDTYGVDVSFVRNWETTMMHFSFLDPFWQAKVKSETLRIPDAADVIEDKCSRCHAPMASIQAKYNGDDVFMFGVGGLLDVDSRYHALAMQGVSCTFCHQLEASSTDSGEFSVTYQRMAWGPFFPDFINIMANSTGFTPEFNFHPMDSKFCATCHDLFIDYYDKDGVQQSRPGTLFPEQTPYLEWLSSSFPKEDKSCQNCHMHHIDAVKITRVPRRSTVRKDVLAHTFLTENTMMLDMISSIAESQDLDIPDLYNAIADGEEYIAGAGGIEILEPVQWIDAGGDNQYNDLKVTLKVTNDAGHKLPTSIPVRRVFIHFAVYDSAGKLLFSSGDTDEEGRIVGTDLDEAPQLFEPHYDLITQEDEVHVYEGIMENWEGEVTYSLFNAARFAKDNRLLPRGFYIETAPEEIWPVGVTDDNFVGGEDKVTYIISNISARGEVKIEAELKDQTLSYRMVQDLVQDSPDDDSGLIDLFYEEYQHHKVHYERIDKDEKFVAVEP